MTTAPMTTAPTTTARAARAGDRRLDAVTFLSLFLVCLTAIESRLVVGPLGAAGNPATLVAVAGLAWWLWHHLQRSVAQPPRAQPVRIALLILFWAVTASYATAMARPIDGLEASSANLGMISLLGWLGVALLAHDGVPTIDRFEVLVRRVVVAGTLLSVLALAQFAFHDILIRGFAPPGLTSNVPLGDLLSRNGFTRPSATALHPIELGAVLTTILPLAIARARSVGQERAMVAWACVAVLGFGIVVCGSRSAVLCAAVGLLVLVVAWPPRARATAAVAVALLLGAVMVTIPGMAGTLLKLFAGAGSDDGIASRTDSYAMVGQYFLREPLLGRGLATFLPSYRILDNQYLLLLLDIGLVGLASFFLVVVAALVCGRRARRLATDTATREHGQACAAAVAAAAAGMATYDGLSFPMATGMLFLVVGMSGALWRLTRDRMATPPRSTAREGTR